LALPKAAHDKTPDHGNKKVSVKRVLDLLVWGILCGKRTLRDLETQSEIQGDRISDTTLHDVLVRLSPEGMPKLIASQVKQALESKELQPEGQKFHQVAIDGKNIYTERATVDKEGKARSVHDRCNMALRATLVSTMVTQILGERHIPDKGAETIELVPLIDHLRDLYGKTNLLKLISVDAGMVSKSNAQALVERQLWYLMAIKDNQPEVLRVTQRITEDAPIRATKTDWHHGEEVVRTLAVADVSGRLSQWPHATEVWKIVTTKTNKITRQISHETRFFIVNIPPGTLTAHQKLEAIRRHWRTENNAFWTLDACFGEDSAPFTSHALQLISLVRIMVYNILARFRGRRMKSQKNRVLRWHDYFSYFFAAFCVSAAPKYAHPPNA
jgi:predicted transposase YbfD/YdcC